MVLYIHILLFLCIFPTISVKEGDLMTNLFFPIDIPYLTAYRDDSPASPVGPHAHDGAEIYLTLTDLPDVLIGDRIYTAPAGTLILIPPFCVHQLYHEALKNYERYVLNINNKWISGVFFYPSQLLPGLKTNDLPLLIPLEDSEKKKLMKQFHKLLAYDEPTSSDALVCFFELLGILKGSAENTASDFTDLPVSAAHQKVNEIIAFIEEHLSENITITALSEHFYLNGDYLARLFKKYAHVSLGHYITVQKISASQKMLRAGLSVEHVAESMNYSNYSHFFKTFQKITGRSPSRYRKLYLG